MNRVSQPVEERFSREQVLRILGLSARQLNAWEHQGLVPPPAAASPGIEQTKPEVAGRSRTASAAGTDRLYTFSDIVAFRTLLELRRQGVPPARIRSIHAALKSKLSDVERPWSELQVQTHGKRLSVHFQGRRMEPLTGQLLLEYAPKNQKATVRMLERPGPRTNPEEAQRELRAERFFRAGLRYEESSETLPKAIRAYWKAIDLNPCAVGAFINLGTIYYNSGELEEAERCYHSALALDPSYALAHFNLANVFDEKNEWEKARRHYEEAVRLSPNYPDPRYNLALVYEKLGQHGRARRQWLAYLKLEARGQWADFARQQLAKTSLRVLPRKAPPHGDS